MYKKIFAIMVLTLTSLMAQEKIQKEVKNYTLEVNCVNECFNLLTATDNFNRGYVNQCLLTCGVSDSDLQDKLNWQEKELDRLEATIDKMRQSKYLGKPFICVD